MTVTLAALSNDSIHVKMIARGMTTPIVIAWGLPDVWVDCPCEMARAAVSGIAYLGNAYDKMPLAAQKFGRKKWPDEAALFGRDGQPHCDYTDPDPQAKWGYQDVQREEASSGRRQAVGEGVQ